MRMTKEAISLHSLNETLNRVENKLQNVEREFKELNSAMEKLTQKLQFQDKTLEKLVGEDEMWISLLEDRFTSVEINLFYSYVSEILCCLHSCVRAKLPDLAGGLPTLASVMRCKGKNQRIRLVWEAVLEMLGMQEGDVSALCTFFIIHCSEARYYPANQRQKYTSDISMMITKVVKNQILQQSLLCAVQVVETRRAQMDPKKIATHVQK
ncbi:single-pass membrane and coiled-coil domain-containing protein 1 [Chelonoidis abingdonii]|uniref:single-pass membrane and coiled-coil domain-containing protein 1 n=1 Tax=Chelonoidis abingdonii TaxID=106734 RepID=UPI0013F1FD3D|nr:single-pass membrane and coiled-coil domain-containing protein 1 isoform X1 [Chelonoidis abingdonii]